MKGFLIVFGLLTISPAFGQGIITFYNNNLVDPGTGQLYRAGIFRQSDFNPADPTSGWQTVGMGAGYTAGLFLAENLSTPLATTAFRTTTAPEVFATSQDVTVPGHAPGTVANFVVRVWTTAAGSYDAAKAIPGALFGEEAFLSKPLGGPNPNPPPPAFFTPDMAPFTGFNIYLIPEPTVLGMGVVGACGLLLLRRRRLGF